MASKEEIQQRVNSIRERAFLSLIKNLVTGFGGPAAGAALFQAHEDITQLAQELKAVQQELDSAPYTMPEVTVLGTPTVTIPEVVLTDDETGQVINVPQVTITDGDDEPGEDPGGGGIPATPEGYHQPSPGYGGGGGATTAPGGLGVHDEAHRPFHSPPGDPP